jgi:hypothetical protein
MRVGRRRPARGFRSARRAFLFAPDQNRRRRLPCVFVAYHTDLAVKACARVPRARERALARP